MSAALQGPPVPGFAVMEDQLGNLDALTVVARAAGDVSDAALTARRLLLNSGFTPAHSVCRELDGVSRHWTIVHGAAFRQREAHIGRAVIAFVARFAPAEVSR